MPSEREDSNNISPLTDLHQAPALADTLPNITEQTPPPPPQPTTLTGPKRGDGNLTTNPPPPPPARGATRSAKPSP